jgi:hypothetical protein
MKISSFFIFYKNDLYFVTKSARYDKKQSNSIETEKNIIFEQTKNWSKNMIFGP